MARPPECEGCYKYYQSKCIAFTDLFHRWGVGVCWAKELDGERWEQTLVDMANYRRTGYTGGAVEDESVSAYLPLSSEIRSCLRDDATRHHIKGGSSDKNPSIWGKSRMSDNRYKEPWTK